MANGSNRFLEAEFLRNVGLYCGVALAVCFFLPQGESGSELVMAWDLAGRSGKLGFLMVFAMVAGLALVVMSVMPAVPHGARAAVTALAGAIPILVFAAVARDFSRALPGVTPTASVFFFGMFALMLGLFQRMLHSGSAAARVLVGIGILLLVLHYLIPQASLGGEKVMPLVAAFRAISSGKEVRVISGIMMLLPFLGAFFAAVALPRYSGNPALERGVEALAWGYLCYLPVFLLALTVMFLVNNPGVHVVGMLAASVMCGAYLLLFTVGTSHTFTVLGRIASMAGLAGAGSQGAGASRGCPSCGESLEPGVQFCNNCGKNLAPVGRGAPKTRVERGMTKDCLSCHLKRIRYTWTGPSMTSPTSSLTIRTPPSLDGRT